MTKILPAHLLTHKLFCVIRFEKTTRTDQGRTIYRERNTGRLWYVDNLHCGKAAHLEVFNSTGKQHLGEADLQGNIDRSKRDTQKTIDL